MTTEVIKELDSIKVEELLQIDELTNLRQVKQVDGLKNCQIKKRILIPLGMII